MPKVDVEGAGTLSFPVPDAQIASVRPDVRREVYLIYRECLRNIVRTPAVSMSACASPARTVG